MFLNGNDTLGVFLEHDLSVRVGLGLRLRFAGLVMGTTYRAGIGKMLCSVKLVQFSTKTTNHTARLRDLIGERINQLTNLFLHVIGLVMFT